MISAGTLMPLLGVTWVIGLFAVNEDTIVFAWIFAVLNSLQVQYIRSYNVLYLFHHSLLN